MISKFKQYNGADEYRGQSTDVKPVANNGDVFHEIDTGKDFMFNESTGDWKEQPKKGGGVGLKLTKVTIINNRTETTISYALFIYGTCDEKGLATQYILRGGGRSKEVYVPNGNPETQDRYPYPCIIEFYANSNIPINVNSDIHIESAKYSVEGKQRYVVMFFADGNPITLTVNNG